MLVGAKCFKAGLDCFDSARHQSWGSDIDPWVRREVCGRKIGLGRGRLSVVDAISAMGNRQLADH